MTKVKENLEEGRVYKVYPIFWIDAYVEREYVREDKNLFVFDLKWKPDGRKKIKKDHVSKVELIEC